MDSDDDYEESTASYRGVPATIILIDVLNPKAEIAHAATCRVIRQYLRQSGSHLVGVCLFGENNVMDIFPLTTPTLEDYKMLQGTKISNLEVGKEHKLSKALLHCSKVFANCKKRLSTRTVIILTRLDTAPIQTDQTPALKRAEDLAQSNVYIKLINVSETEHEGDKFYKYFLTNANKERYENLPKPISDVKKIEKLMYQESHRHLAVARLSFEIGNGMSIGVGLYNLLKDSRQSLKSAYLNSETNEIVNPVTETLKVSRNSAIDVYEEGQEPKRVPLLKSELVYWQEYGGERVEMTDTDMKFLQNPFGPPMLKLLGFKPATLLSKEKWYLRKGYFLFPNEDIIEGSTVAFKALYQACIETGMVAICMLCTRVNSRPMNVALSPCTNPLGLDVDVGFDVIHIPFVQNVRNVPEIDDVELNITNSHKTVLKDIINAVKFDYKADMFENPRVQSQYKNLEAIAFDEEDIEAFTDTTMPNPDKFNNLDSDLFQEIFGPFASFAVKRPGGSQGTGNAKKMKTEEIDDSTQIKTEEIDMSTLQSRVVNRKVYQYTVPQMKQILKSKEIPDLPALTGLKKEQLVELVYRYFKF